MIWALILAIMGLQMRPEAVRAIKGHAPLAEEARDLESAYTGKKAALYGLVAGATVTTAALPRLARSAGEH